MQYEIGEYYEIKQGHPTSRKSEIITVTNIVEARRIADEKYGWGSWARIYNQEGEQNEY